MVKRRKKTRSEIEGSLRIRAERKVRNKTGLLWLLYSVGSYVLINGLLIAIWIISDSDYPWFLWVMAIWAGALAFHVAGYVIGFRYGASRERMIEEQMEAYRKKKGMTPADEVEQETMDAESGRAAPPQKPPDEGERSEH